MLLLSGTVDVRKATPTRHNGDAVILCIVRGRERGPAGRLLLALDALADRQAMLRATASAASARCGDSSSA